MNIVYTVDNKFVPQLATGICSICENNKEEDVCFYVVSKGITDDNKDALTRYVEKYGKKICIIELSNVKDYIDLEKAYFTQRKLKEELEDNMEILMKRNYEMQRTINLYLLEYGEEIINKDKRINEQFRSRFDEDEGEER